MLSVIALSGSFLTIWLATWFTSAVFLLAVYPAIRSRLLQWHPASASRVLLLLFSFPFLLSLSTTILLFLPVMESNLVSEHCHRDCQSHIPLIRSVWIVAAGIGLALLIAGFALRRLLFNLHTVKRLMTQLTRLGQLRQGWYLLPDARPIVFTLGWWRNRIFISEGLLRQCAPKDIEIILGHEQAHVQRYDNLRLLLARMFLLVLPARLEESLYNDLHFFTESACDFQSARAHGDLNVAETLLRVQKLVPTEFYYHANSLHSAFTGSEVESRIRSLAAGIDHFREARHGQALVVILLLMLSFSLVDPLHHGIEWMLGLH